MRNQLIVVLVAVTILALVVGALAAFQSDDTRVIPLNRIYATFDQDDLKSADAAFEVADYAEAMNVLREGSGQIVLCDGKDIAAAVKGSMDVFTLPADPMPSTFADSRSSFWVAAYFGAEGSMPPAFEVRSVEVTGMTIRVSFERMPASSRSCDLRDYMIWAPVGRLESGMYTLELFDVSANNVVLVRTWMATSR